MIRRREFVTSKRPIGYHESAVSGFGESAVAVTCSLRQKKNVSSDYGFLGTAPGLNKSERSIAFTASPRNGPTWKISCMVRRSEECVKLSGLA